MNSVENRKVFRIINNCSFSYIYNQRSDGSQKCYERRFNK